MFRGSVLSRHKIINLIVGKYVAYELKIWTMAEACDSPREIFLCLDLFKNSEGKYIRSVCKELTFSAYSFSICLGHMTKNPDLEEPY
jgi:hypothetical protein